MAKSRIHWIDIARGIGILLVVYGHALSAGNLRSIIYSFHMPLFFFLSGVVFSYKPEETWHSFIKKNARNILIPYVLFAVLGFGIWLVTKHPAIDQVGLQFLSIFYGNGNNGLLAFNNLLWFLPCLFISRVGFFALTRYSTQNRQLWLSLFLFSIMGFAYSIALPSVKLPFGIETALTAIVFVGIGYLWMQRKTSEIKIFKRFEMLFSNRVFIFGIATALLVICIASALLSMHLYGFQVDMRQDKLHNYFLLYLGALSGIYGAIGYSMLLKENKILEYLGKQSLVIFAWHLLAFPYVSRFLSVTHLKPLLKELPLFTSPIVYCVLAILLVLLLATPIQWIVGKMRHRD